MDLPRLHASATGLVPHRSGLRMRRRSRHRTVLHPAAAGLAALHRSGHRTQRFLLHVRPEAGQLLMRHRSIETTLKYYVAQDADQIADELWKDFSEESRTKAPEDQDVPPGG